MHSMARQKQFYICHVFSVRLSLVSFIGNCCVDLVLYSAFFSVAHVMSKNGQTVTSKHQIEADDDDDDIIILTLYTV